MTPLPVSIAAAVASFLLLVVVFELIRSRRLRERYALLWLLTGAVLLALSLWRDGLNTIGFDTNVSTPVKPRRSNSVRSRSIFTVWPPTLIARGRATQRGMI